MRYGMLLTPYGLLGKNDRNNGFQFRMPGRAYERECLLISVQMRAPANDNRVADYG